MQKVFLLTLMIFLLAGCSVLPQASPTPLPTVVLDSGSSGAVNSEAPTAAINQPTAAINQPTAAQTQLTAASQPATEQPPAQSTAAVKSPAAGGRSFSASGKVAPAQQAQVASALGGSVLSTEVNVGDAVRAGQVLVKLAGSEKLNAALQAALFEQLSAQKALNDLQENATQARAAAQLRLAKAKDALDLAEKHRGWKEYRVGNDNQLAVAQADLIVAEDHLKKTEDIYNDFADSTNDDLNKAAALSARAAARTARDKAQANLNYLLSLPDSIEVAKADAELAVAQAEVEAAQRDYDRLKDGPNESDRVLAEARLKNAKAQVTASQAALADLELKAPFDGVVSKVNVHSGEWATPGQVILVLADLAHLRVETTDLSERDIPQVANGQAVTVLIKPLNQQIQGQVKEVSPLADTMGGDVVYQTIIELKEQPAALRAGMSVEVQFAGQ